MSHHYDRLYCPDLMPFWSKTVTQRPLRVLEIGFGCGHHTHGASALMWKRFFHSNGGPGVQLYEIDYGPLPAHDECVRNFNQRYPNRIVAEKIFLGDQANKTFMVEEVLRQSGGKFDVIIDDGGHWPFQIRASFGVLWSELMPGGVYFVEDLGVFDSNENDGWIRETLGWANQLMTGQKPQSVPEKDKPKRRRLKEAKAQDTKVSQWLQAPSPLPEGMISVGCVEEMCSYHKGYSSSWKDRQSLTAPQPSSSLASLLPVTRSCSLQQIAESIGDKKLSTYESTYASYYCRWLDPLKQAAVEKKRRVRLLEFGVGCVTGGTSGADKNIGMSATRWKKYFGSTPGVSLFAIEKGDAKARSCVEESFQKLHPDVMVLIDSQKGEPDVAINAMIKKTGGMFDVIIDGNDAAAGGKGSDTLLNNFKRLWPHLMPGGLYFVEGVDKLGTEIGFGRWLLGALDFQVSGSKIRASNPSS